MAKTNTELNSLNSSVQEQKCLIKIAGDQFQTDKRMFLYTVWSEFLEYAATGKQTASVGSERD